MNFKKCIALIVLNFSAILSLGYLFLMNPAIFIVILLVLITLTGKLYIFQLFNWTYNLKFLFQNPSSWFLVFVGGRFIFLSRTKRRKNQVVEWKKPTNRIKFN